MWELEYVGSHGIPHLPPVGRLDLGARDRCLLRKVSLSLKGDVGKVCSLSCPGNLDGHRKATE